MQILRFWVANRSSLLVYSCIKRYSSYDDYKVINSIKIDGSTESKYLSYKDFVIKYSGDGISYIDDDGTVWNEAFQMKSPMVDICGDYIAVADKTAMMFTYIIRMAIRER